MDKRLALVSDSELTLKTAFLKSKRSHGESGIKYALKRTYMRPRDIISFVNYAIENAHSKTHFTNDILHKAEIPYSTDRFHALEDEWRENYGEIEPLCKFLNGITDGFKLKSLNEDSFAEIYIEDDAEKRFKGTLLEIAISWRSGKVNSTAFFKKAIYLLYHIGIIGVKKGPKHSTSFFYDDLLITRDDISNNNTYYVHPALYSHFKVITMEQLPQDSR